MLQLRHHQVKEDQNGAPFYYWRDRNIDNHSLCMCLQVIVSVCMHARCIQHKTF